MASFHFARHPVRTTVSFIKAACLVHLGLTYGYTISPAQGPSMLPTFTVDGDWILCDHTRRYGRGVSVGDLVVYRIPIFNSQWGVKRVTGMPGDYVSVGTPGEPGEELMIQVDDLTFILVLEFIVGLDLSVCNASNVFDDILSFTDESDQSLILRLEQLKKGPHGNVLECGITRLQESAKVSVDSALGLGPVLREVAQGSSTVTLNLDAWRMSKRDENTTNSQVQEMGLEVVAQGQDCNSSSHLGLNSNGYIKNQLLALLHSASIQDKSLVAIRTGCQISEG
ncbi:hypothetical protein HG530_005544 [Fusarium avenaceum]|nr:hypothetical protein HG530_005544 [Fusarium avenaceum]